VYLCTIVAIYYARLFNVDFLVNVGAKKIEKIPKRSLISLL
jgi:hypothetical protein